MTIKLTVQPKMTIWYNKPQDIAILYLNFSDYTVMKVHYKKIKKGLLNPERIEYEGRTLEGIKAEVTADRSKFQWILDLEIPQMNFKEQIKFHPINGDKNTSMTMISNVLKRQTQRFAESFMECESVLTDEEVQKRKNKTLQAAINYKKKKEEEIETYFEEKTKKSIERSEKLLKNKCKKHMITAQELGLC